MVESFYSGMLLSGTRSYIYYESMCPGVSDKERRENNRKDGREKGHK